jgi:hypothetical protein
MKPARHYVEPVVIIIFWGELASRYLSIQGYLMWTRQRCRPATVLHDDDAGPGDGPLEEALNGIWHQNMTSEFARRPHQIRGGI